MLCLLPPRFNKGPLADLLGCATIVLFIGMLIYAARLCQRERAAVIASTLDAPEDEHLLTYILAFHCDRGEVHDQAAQAVAVLLARLSEDKLACISDEDWSRLCPPSKESPMGFIPDDRANRDDDLNVAVFLAIMKLGRMKSLPYIERLTKSEGLSSHSESYVRTLTECHQALLANRICHEQSATLLRPSAAKAATPGELLRPVSGTQQFETETTLCVYNR